MQYITLTKDKQAKVDDSDFDWLNQWKWHCTATGYASRRVYIGTGAEDNRGYFLRMHREIIQAPPDSMVDHINGDKLDNRRSNLRLANNGENLRNRGKQSNNTSGFKGVSWHKGADKWMAQITVDRQTRYLGLFINLEDAAQAYKKATKKYHGEFACV